MDGGVGFGSEASLGDVELTKVGGDRLQQRGSSMMLFLRRDIGLVCSFYSLLLLPFIFACSSRSPLYDPADEMP